MKQLPEPNSSRAIFLQILLAYAMLAILQFIGIIPPGLRVYFAPMTWAIIVCCGLWLVNRVVKWIWL